MKRSQRQSSINELAFVSPVIIQRLIKIIKKLIRGKKISNKDREYIADGQDTIKSLTDLFDDLEPHTLKKEKDEA